jgi:hypothetical protein
MSTYPLTSNWSETDVEIAAEPIVQAKNGLNKRAVNLTLGSAVFYGNV